MRITEKLAARKKDLRGSAPVTVAFLGDSVTQGCFECYINEKGEIDTVFDPEAGYSAKLRHILHTLYPRAQINIVNAGISGDSAKGGLERIERDVLPFSPDLTVVSFGLNDCGGGIEKLPKFAERLRSIFDALQKRGSEVVYLAPCMTDTYVSSHIKDNALRAIASQQAEREKGGVLEAYVDEAKKVAEACGVRVCDCYHKWKRMEACGVDTTSLLANHINHPMREMHWMIANSLIEIIFS